MRNSRHPDGDVPVHTAEEFRAFLRGAHVTAGQRVGIVGYGGRGSTGRRSPWPPAPTSTSPTRALPLESSAPRACPRTSGTSRRRPSARSSTSGPPPRPRSTRSGDPSASCRSAWRSSAGGLGAGASLHSRFVVVAVLRKTILEYCGGCRAFAVASDHAKLRRPGNGRVRHRDGREPAAITSASFAAATSTTWCSTICRRSVARLAPRPLLAGCREG